MPIFQNAASSRRVDLNTSANAATKLKPQAQLNDAEFAETLSGYKQLQDPVELFNVALGGRVRYVIDVQDDHGQFLERKFRYGGILTVVDPALRYIMLKNVVVANANKANNNRGGKSSWSVQLKDPKQKVTLYYCEPAKQGELAMYRQMMSDIENGKLQINKM